MKNKLTSHLLTNFNWVKVDAPEKENFYIVNCFKNKTSKKICWLFGVIQLFILWFILSVCVNKSIMEKNLSVWRKIEKLGNLKRRI